jgi:large subunit ribosomal protein L24
MKLKKGDLVQIIRGKDKGKTEKIERVFAKEEMVLLPNLNQYKRHVKGKMEGQPSEIKTIGKPLHTTNVVLICPKCSKPTRVGYLVEKGKKERICRKCKKVI